MRPNGPRLSCGRNGRGRKEVEQLVEAGSSSTVVLNRPIAPHFMAQHFTMYKRPAVYGGEVLHGIATDFSNRGASPIPVSRSRMR